jgi:uncharacterized membrane-anchored protein YitT (DUF2179 family)
MYNVPWNLFLITSGCLIFGFGLKAIAIPHGFISGGISGLSLLVYYLTGKLSPGTLYFLINIPIFIVGWVFVSRRFFLYSAYGMLILSIAIDAMPFTVQVHDPFLAVLAGGAVMGAGAGITLRSLGSAGGNDIVAIILNQKFNFRIGTFYFGFNLVLFAFSLGFLETDVVLYSLALNFVTAQVLDYFLSIFNQRKMVLIISDKAVAIADAISEYLRRGATFIEGTGAYTGQRKTIVMTVVNNYQLKRLEEAVFTIDQDAFVITENTFNVLGKGFSYRKVY